MPEDLMERIRAELRRQADEKNRELSARYFKEPISLYGVKNAVVGRIARQFYPGIKHLDKQAIFACCEELMKSGLAEEFYIACDWAYRQKNSFEEGDFPLLERWVTLYVHDWAACDTLCNHTIGAFVDRFPQYLEKLKEWSRSDNRWLRRASAVTLILPAREGKFLEDIFTIADSLLSDREDLVQKGYGWMLKEASKQHQEEVFAYILKNRQVMPRTALRYAIEKMPAEKKKEAMQR